MNFNELGFIIFALIALFLVHLPLQDVYRKTILLLLSYYFYSFWDYRFVPLLLLMTAISYYAVMLMERTKKLLPAIVTLLLMPLILFKYTQFILDNILNVFGTTSPNIGVVLPIGISFFTFHTISYVCDVHAGKINREKSLLNYALYIAFFPQLIAGPIVRAPDFLPQMRRAWQAPQARIMALALLRFLWGMFKKTAIADPLSYSYVDPTFDNISQISGPAIIIGILAFGLVIYIDFSAYSDMAISLSRMLGYKIKENFRAPYTATSIQDFWRRWHVSLSLLIRDYVYFPLGGSNNQKSGRIVFNLMAAMLLCGAWHGAAWNFIIWGGWHGIALCLARFFPFSVPLWLGWVLTQITVMSGWFLFRISDLGDLNIFLTQWQKHGLKPFDLSYPHIFLFLAYWFLIMLEQVVIRLWEANFFHRKFKLKFYHSIWTNIFLSCGVFVLIMLLVDHSHRNKAFIYFQF